MAFDPDAYLAQKPKPKSGFDPDAYLSAAPPPEKSKAPSWGDALMAAPGAALDELVGGAKAAGHFVASLPSDPLGYKIARGVAALPGAVARDVGGIVQFARNQSPAEFQGTAPALPGGEAENHPWLALATGDTGPMRQAVAQHPLALAADVAGVAGMTAPGRKALGMLADAAKAPVRGIARTIADMHPTTRAENALLGAADSGAGRDATIAALQGNTIPVPGVQLSAAQVTQDPQITALERRSRINAGTGPGWATFDSGQNTAMVNALQGIVGPATDNAVDAAKIARDEATKYGRKAALSLADQHSLEPNAPAWMSMESYGVPQATNQFAQPIRDAALGELDSARGAANPSVKTTGNYVLGAIPRTGATADTAYEVRKRLADALNARAGQDTTELGAAVKSSDVSTRAMKTAIDSSLNKASGGLWQDYLDAFQANSKDVNSIQALSNIREELASKVAGGALDANGNPKLSRAYLAQIIERHSTGKFGDLIAPAVKKRLDALVDTAQKIEAPQANYRAAVTGGGGSNTPADLALSAGKHLVGAAAGGTAARALGMLGSIANSLGERTSAETLAQMLQSPYAAAQGVKNAAEREAARRAAKSSGRLPAILAAAMAAQQQQ